MGFELNIVVPVASVAHGLIASDEVFLFAASNSIFQLKKNKIIFVISLHGKIEDISYENGFIFARTRSVFYMITNDKIVATMKIKTDFCFTVLDRTVFIANQKNISQYELPNMFKPFPFEKLSDVRAHSGSTLRMISLPKENMLISMGTDCTVRLNSSALSISKVLMHFTEEPVAIFHETIGIRKNEQNTNTCDGIETGQKVSLRGQKPIRIALSYEEASEQKQLLEKNEGHHSQDSNTRNLNAFHINHAINNLNDSPIYGIEEYSDIQEVQKFKMSQAGDSKHIHPQCDYSIDHFSQYNALEAVKRRDLLDHLKNDYLITAISSNGKFFQYCTRKTTLKSRIYLNKPILSAAQRGNTFFLLGEDKEVYAIKNQNIAQLSLEEQGYEIACDREDVFIRGEYFLNQYRCTDNEIDNLILKKIVENNSGDVHNMNTGPSSQNQTSKCSEQHLLLLAPIPLPKIIDFSYNKDIAVISSNNLIIRYKTAQDHLLVLSFLDTEVPVARVFFKKNVILVITECSKVMAFDTTRSIKFRDIQLETDLFCADTNEDNSLLIFGDNTHFHLLDIRTSKILESIGTSAPVTKIYIMRNSIFCLLMSNDIIKYDILTRKYDNFESKTTISSLAVINQKLVISHEKSLLINNSQMETEKSLNCWFKSRSRNEMSVADKPVTAVALSYDDRVLICGARANELRVYDISTGVLLQTIKLSRNKELENYKKKLGREKAHDFLESDVIETLKIEYCPNGFFLLSREGVSLYRTTSFKKMSIVNQISVTQQLDSLIEQNKWADAVDHAVASENIADLVKIIDTLPVYRGVSEQRREKTSIIQENRNGHERPQENNNGHEMPQENTVSFNWLSTLDTTIKAVSDHKALKHLLNTLLLTKYHPKTLLWLNRLVYHRPGMIIDSDLLVIELLKQKYNKLT